MIAEAESGMASVRLVNGRSLFTQAGEVPTILQGICRNCGHKTPLLSEGYGAIFVDQSLTHTQHEVAGAVIQAGEAGAMATVDDARFLILRHPVEEPILRESGYVWSDLLRQGRYVWVTNVVCRECGTIFQRRRLRAPGTFGCTAALVSGLAAGLAVGLWTRSAPLGLLASCAGALAVALIAGAYAAAYLRLRFTARAKAIAAERLCPTCRADNARKLALYRSVVCPICHTRRLRFLPVGVS